MAPWHDFWNFESMYSRVGNHGQEIRAVKPKGSLLGKTQSKSETPLVLMTQSSASSEKCTIDLSMTYPGR